MHASPLLWFKNFLLEATRHPHNVARGIYRIVAGGAIEATAAPRFHALTAGVPSRM
jgi:hypothetical protein